MRKRRILAALTALCLLALCAPISGALAASRYYITVDLTNQIVTVYDSENTDDSNIVRQMICSSGRPATPTPTGTFYLPSKSQSSERSEWYYFPKFKCYAKWATRIRGGILFHSTLFSSAKKGPTSTSTRALGSKASHGCVRLRVNDAKFIAKNCLSGTKCRIFSSGKTNSTLRSKLKRKSFDREVQSYDSFMGRKPKESALPLSRGSTGSLVSQLQTRLKALGFYKGEVNATMGKSTVTAVKAFQSASGIKQTSRVNQALWDAIFADSAPTGTLVTLSQGSSGPAVTVLQNNLITLLMLEGAADGSFGSTTKAAVKKYQTTFGFTVDGKADTDLQDDINSRAAQVRQEFGDSAYALTTVTVDAQMAKIKAKSGTKLRQTASKKGKKLKSLKYNAAMRVLSDGKNWTKVRYDARTGYVVRTALKFYTEPVTEYTYVKVELPEQPTVETDPTPEVSVPATDPTADPEVSIPTPAEENVLTEARDEPVEQEVPLEDTEDAPEDDPEALVFGTEPVETPEEVSAASADNGLEVEGEADGAPVPEGEPEAEAAGEDPPSEDEGIIEASED